MLIERKILATGDFLIATATELVALAKDITVELEQISSGKIFLYGDALPALVTRIALGLEPSLSFVGRLPDGQKVRGEQIENFLTGDKERSCLVLRRVVVGDIPSEQISRFQLELTNLTCSPKLPGLEEGLTLPDGDDEIHLQLEGSDGYPDRVLHLQKTRLCTVTSKLTVRGRKWSSDEMERTCREICAALSFLQGSKVQWIWRSFETVNGCTSFEFGETLTKNPTSRSLCLAAGASVVLTFDKLPTSFPRVQLFCRQCDDAYRIINSWLDARLQEDFLEARTLKYVVVIEALCTAMLGAKVKGFETKLRETLKVLSISLCNHDDQVKNFIEIRNRIVHEFRYANSLDPNRSEHFEAAAFVDEILLRLFGLGSEVDSRVAMGANVANSART